MIYFIRRGDEVKIGYSADASQRLRQLQTGSAVRLEMLGIIDGEPDYEDRLHQHWHRYRLGGEWFRVCDEITSFIAARCRMPPASADLRALREYLGRKLMRCRGGEVRAEELYNRYKDWCVARCRQPLVSKDFAASLPFRRDDLEFRESKAYILDVRLSA